MPHTVQFYALDDPSPTYGNSNFSYVADYIALFCPQRPTLFHPETAYWVNFDVDVPLFLPLYALARARDAVALAAMEVASGCRIGGGVFFSSGWEWGYWLNDIVAAELMFAPPAPGSDPSVVLRGILSQLLNSAAYADAVVGVAEAQRAFLIFGGQKTGRALFRRADAPAPLERANGQAYLEGWDTWSDLMSITRAQTQPRRLALGRADSRVGGAEAEFYSLHVAPLLSSLRFASR